MNFVLWFWYDEKWKSRYSVDDVCLMADMIHRNYRKKHKIYCVTDRPELITREDIEPIQLWDDLKEFGHCYKRLKAFSYEFGEMIGGKLCSIDLDCVITGDITQLVDNCPDFAIAKDYQPPTPYNGSFFILSPSARLDVWDKWNGYDSIKEANKKGYCACDQAHIANVLGANEFKLGESAGVYSYRMSIQKTNNDKLPDNAKIVMFHGNPKPKDCMHLDWVKEAYRPSKRAIVLGGAESVWKELASCKDSELLKKADIIAVNDAGCEFPEKLAYWVTLHPEKFDNWLNERILAGFDTDFVSVGYGNVNETEERIPDNTDLWTNDWGGSSGLFAVKVAFEQGYDEVFLCGCPMNGDKNAFRGKKWDDFKTYRVGWTDKLDELKGRVFSLSGWTKDLLGASYNG